MDIKINSKYSLTSDTHNWIISRDGKQQWFYSSLYDALWDAYFNEIPKQSKATNDIELISFLKNSAEKLWRTLNTIQKEGLKSKKPIIPEKIKLNGFDNSKLQEERR